MHDDLVGNGVFNQVFNLQLEVRDSSCRGHEEAPVGGVVHLWEAERGWGVLVSEG